MLEELTKRRIFRTLAIYVALAWAVTEVLITVADRLGVPEWVGTAIVILFIAGFPLATLFAWMYDIEDGRVRRVATARKGLMAGVLATATIASAAFAILFYVKDTGPLSTPPAQRIDGLIYGTSRPQPLTTMEGFEFDPALSPSGGHLAFVIQEPDRPVSRLHVKEVTGDNVVRLSDGEQLEKNPAWSPDGTQIAFIRAYGRLGRHDIVAVPMLGGPERILVSEDRPFMHFDWSPDGRTLAIEILVDSKLAGHIAAFDIGTGEWKDLTSVKEQRGDRHPRFSPDGKYIAFLRFEGSANHGSVCVMEVEEEAIQCITPPGVEWAINHLAWLPDSMSLLVAVGETPGLQRLLNISTADGAISVLPFGDDAWRLSVARDTGRLAFERYFVDHNIWRIPGPNASNDAIAQKLISSTWDELIAAYSPDGSRIAFMSTRSGGWAIWVANADGSSPRQVTNWGFENLPSWSPDGQSIGFTSRKYPVDEPEAPVPALVSRPMQAFMVSLAGGVPQSVAEDSVYSVAPAWSHDGRWIYYGRGPYTTCGGEIWKVDTDTGERVFVAECAGHPLEAPDGRVFFERGEHGRQLFSVSSDGGDPVLEMDLRDMTCPTDEFGLGWTLWREYVIYRDCSDFFVKSKHLGSGETRTLADISSDPMQAHEVQLSVSPDGEWILYNRLDRAGSDLFLVEPEP